MSDDDTAVHDRPPEPSPLPRSGIGTLLLHYYRAATLAIVGLLVVGISVFFTLPRTEDPETETWDPSIITLYPGADASKVERQVAEKIEEAIDEVDGIKIIRTNTSDGLSASRVYIHDTADLEATVDDIEKKLRELQPRLPGAISGPDLLQFNAGDIPVLLISMSGPFGYNDLDRFAKRIKTRVLGVANVAGVKIEALPERQVIVKVDPNRLAQYRIPLLRIRDVIERGNAAIPGGKLDIAERRYMLRNPNEFEGLADIGNTVIGSQGASLAFLRDIANVEDGFEEARYYARTNGRPAIILAIRKRPNTDTSRVANEVLARIEAMRPTLPADLELRVISNRGDAVDELLSSLGASAATGAALVTILVALFLGLRQGIIVSVSIPLSVVISFTWMQATGIDLNQISIFGLALALGMVVDASLVVIENIGEQLKAGKPILAAVTTGVEEVNLPVLASILTTIAAFAPLLFLTGNVGDFVRSMPLAMTYALVASYLVAVLVIPLLCYAIWRNSPPPPSGPERELPLLETYEAIAKFALRNRALTLLVAGAIFAGSVMAIPSLGIELFPAAEKRFFLIDVRLPENASLAATDRIIAQVENILSREEPVRDYTANIGKGSPVVYYNVIRENEQANYGQVLVNLESGFLDPVDEYVASLKEKLNAISGATVEPKVLQQGPPAEAKIEIRIFGDDRDELARISEEIQSRIRDVPGAADLRDNMGERITRVFLDLDKEKAGRSGIDSFAFARTVHMALNGEQATELRIDEDDHPVVVRADPKFIREISDLNKLYLPSSTGDPVSFAEVARIRQETVFSKLARRNNRRYVSVQSDVSGRLVDEVARDIRLALEGLPLPDGYRIEYGGEQELTEDSFTNLGQAFIVAILLIYGILALQFNSFSQPIVILLTIPFGIIGAVAGLWVTGSPFGMMAFIGIISLAGIVINDSILLTDYANYLQRVEGRGMNESLLLAGRRRFQPVFLTSISTIVGLLPLAIWGGSLWSPLANSLIFGLAFSTALILLLLPVIYSVMVRKNEKTRRYRLVPSLWESLIRSDLT